MSQTARMPEPERKPRKTLNVVKPGQKRKRPVRVSARERDAYLHEIFGPVARKEEKI